MEVLILKNSGISNPFAKWHKANLDKGLCFHCGRNPLVTKYRCVDCKQKLNVYRTSRRIKIRQIVIEHYGGRCSCCGEDRYEFLAIDYINGGGRQHMRSLGLKTSESFCKWIIKNNYPNDLRILCHNCNSALGYYGYCPHQQS